MDKAIGLIGVVLVRITRDLVVFNQKYAKAKV